LKVLWARDSMTRIIGGRVRTERRIGEGGTRGIRKSVFTKTKSIRLRDAPNRPVGV